MIRLRLRCVLGVLSAFTLGGCGLLLGDALDYELAPDAPGAAVDGGEDEPSVVAPVLPGLGSDAGVPPADFSCGAADAWSLNTKARPECASRVAVVIENEPVFGTTGISIARTPAGRIGITYNAEMGAESGEMHLAHFMASSRNLVPQILKRQKGDLVHAGRKSRIVASAPDELAVVAHDVDDGDRHGDVVLVRLVSGIAPLKEEELVASVVAWPSEIAAASDNGGSIYASVLVRTGTTDGGEPIAKLILRRKSAANASSFESLPDVATNLLPGAAAETGAASLVVDPAGQVHVAYHHCDDAFGRSLPRYRSFDGRAWTAPKALAVAGSHQAGVGLRLALFGTRKFASFFFRKQFQTVDSSADLHLVSWELATEQPGLEIVDQALPSPETAMRYRAAMAVDTFGLVHVAIVRPRPSNAIGTLEYLRQTRSSDGIVRWLMDIVDPDVVSSSEVDDASVDLVVDDSGRPHIAYVSGTDLKVRYATRFDR